MLTSVPRQRRGGRQRFERESRARAAQRLGSTSERPPWRPSGLPTPTPKAGYSRRRDQRRPLASCGVRPPVAGRDPRRATSLPSVRRERRGGPRPSGARGVADLSLRPSPCIYGCRAVQRAGRILSLRTHTLWERAPILATSAKLHPQCDRTSLRSPPASSSPSSRWQRPEATAGRLSVQAPCQSQHLAARTNAPTSRHSTPVPVATPRPSALATAPLR
jgi:hypothetical protein